MRYQYLEEIVPVLFERSEFSGTSIFWFVFVAMTPRSSRAAKNEQASVLKNYALANEKLQLVFFLQNSLEGWLVMLDL